MVREASAGKSRAAHHHANFVKVGPSITKVLRYSFFSKWPPPPSWNLVITTFHWLTGSADPRRITLPNFVKIGQSIAEILRSCQKLSILTYCTIISCPHKGWPHLNIAKIFGISILVPVLSCGIVCIIECLAVLRQYWHMMDRQVDKHTMRAHTAK